MSSRSDDGDEDRAEMSTVERFMEANRRRFQREMEKSMGTHASIVTGHMGRAGWSVLLATGWAYRQGRAASRRLEREADEEEQTGLAAKGLAEHSIEEVRRMDTGSASDGDEQDTDDESESSTASSGMPSAPASDEGGPSGETGDNGSSEGGGKEGEDQGRAEETDSRDGLDKEGDDREEPDREGPDGDENGEESPGSDGK
ncbi:hypothetical protein [Salinibacter ruber]|uniref:Uncharacterized protein n=2 Tax=Salinibacter ruber TaxID=146919 RepID=A0A9X2TEU4_9BACT|nr:hypothetical protein [Salinibacter ruber]MCS3660140.1 hypothetical protein [Salinibacter ruber]MCS3709825.1 hypothetical protein [Salinibacter ruber]